MNEQSIGRFAFPGSPPPEEGLLDKEHTALRLGCAPHSLDDPEFLHAIGLPRVKLGKLVRFRPRDIRAAIERGMESFE